LRHRRSTQARAAALAATLVASLAAALGLVATPASAAAPQIEAVLPGGVGDGGPAAQALVNAHAMLRDPSGDLLIGDFAGVRSLTSTNRIDAVPGMPPPPPIFDDGMGPHDYVGVWLAGDAAYYYLAQGELGRRALFRIDPSGASTEVFHQPSDVRESQDLLAVAPSGALVVSRRSWDDPAVASTELRDPAGGTRTLLDHAATAAAVAVDGTVFVVPQTTNDYGTIERVRPDGQVDVVAGPGSYTADRPDGLPATQVRLRPHLLAVDGAGGRVAYTEAFGSGELVRSFPVGGTVTTVAGSATATDRACPVEVTALLVEDDAVLVACGGIRSYALTGAQAPHAGTRLAGLNDAPGVIDSATGTPLSRAFLSPVIDVAADPRNGKVAMATRQGVYTVSGSGGDAKLVQIMSTGEAAETVPADHALTSLDIAYDGIGRLYALYFNAAGAHLDVYDGQTTRTIGGSGTAHQSDNIRDLDIRWGHIEPKRDGTVLYLSQGDLVFQIDLRTGAVTRIAGGAIDIPGEDRFSDERGSEGARLREIRWLGTDPVSGDLLIADGSLHRVDSHRWMRAVNGISGYDYAPTPDGSVYSIGQGTLWRSNGGVHVAAAGWTSWAGGTQSVNGLTLPMTAAMAPLPDNRIVLAEGRAPSAVVRLLGFPSTPWTGAQPSMTLSPALAGTDARLTVRVSSGAAAHAWATVGVRPNWISPNQGDRLAETTAPGTSAEATVSGAPGQRLYASVYGWNADGTSSPWAIVVPVNLPGLPVKVTAAATGALTYGSTSKVTGRLTKPDGTTAIAGEPLTLQMRRKGTSSWSTVGTVTTASDGRVRKDVKPTWSAEFRWIHPVSLAGAQATGPTVRTTVTPKLTTSVTARVKLGRSLVVAGTLTPGKSKTVYVQRYSSGAWKNVLKTTTRSTGNFRVTLTQTKAGTFKYRVYRGAVTDYAAAKSVTSKVVVYK
jgi:hypothetical protein